MITSQYIEQCIKKALPDAEVEVTGDDGVHFEAVVISASFEGKSRLGQHRMVYEALGDKMRAEIHALALRTALPQE